MAGRQPEEEPRRGPFVCEFCAEVWPSARALASHIKAHNKGKAPAQERFPYVPPAAAFGPVAGRRVMPPAMPPLVLPPRRPVAVRALGQPVAVPAAGFFFAGWQLRPRVLVRLPQALPLRDPVVYEAGGRIRMVPLVPNHAFWAPYRMGMAAPEELDLIGLRRRPESPSPSFGSWLNNA